MPTVKGNMGFRGDLDIKFIPGPNSQPDSDTPVVTKRAGNWFGKMLSQKSQKKGTT